MSKDRTKSLFVSNYSRLRKEVTRRRKKEMEMIRDLLNTYGITYTWNRRCALILKQNGHKVVYKHKIWIIQ